MPQDKRLLVCRAVVQKVQRSTDDAESVGVYLCFVVPSIVLQRDSSLTSRIFHVSHPVFAANGRSSVLIVPKVISLDCSKINKRHKYFDAVVTAEAICRRDDAESSVRAKQVADTFSHFVVDSRIVSKLPASIREAANEADGEIPRKCLTPIVGFEQRDSITFRTSQAAKGGLIHCSRDGRCCFRVGHGGMNAGEISENAKNFIFAIKEDFPNVWKYVGEFKMMTRVTEKIRFMEVSLN